MIINKKTFSQEKSFFYNMEKFRMICTNEKVHTQKKTL